MVKVAFTEIGGCGGCSLSFLRTASAFPPDWELVYHPLQLGTEKVPEAVEIFFVGGAICTQDKERIEFLCKLRERSKTVVAFGSCAAVGGIMRFFVRGAQEPKPWQSTHLPLGHFIDCNLSVVGCPPPRQSIERLSRSLSATKKDGFSPFKKLSKITHLSCFDLLDEVINVKLCVGCGLCEASCPTLAIQMVDRVPEFIVERCIRCGVCYARCPQIINKRKWEAREGVRYRDEYQELR